MKPHPDRLAANLAQRARLDAEARRGPFAPPGPDSADARVDLKLLAARVRRALAERGTELARARLAELQGDDLWAGTVQDATARGFAVALEEALSLCAPAPAEAPLTDPADEVFTGAELRKKRDLLVASAGPRVRFTRKAGLLLVDRARDVHADDVLGFEDRADGGTLDGFAPVEGQRPRLFEARFLQPVRLQQGPVADVLELRGRLGRRRDGYPCRLDVVGRKDRARIELRIAVENRHADHRLRLRLRGLPADYPVEHDGTPGFERVEARGRWFLAATLVRACGWLAVGDRRIAVPGAQCIGWHEHTLRLGAPQEPA